MRAGVGAGDARSGLGNRSSRHGKVLATCRGELRSSSGPRVVNAAELPADQVYAPGRRNAASVDLWRAKWKAPMKITRLEVFVIGDGPEIDPDKGGVAPL